MQNCRAFRLLPNAELQHLRRYPSGRTEAVLQVSSPEARRAGHVSRLDYIKVIIPADKKEQIAFGPLEYRTDFSSDIRNKHSAQMPLSEKVARRLQSFLEGLNPEDEVQSALRDILSSRLNPSPQRRLLVTA